MNRVTLATRLTLAIVLMLGSFFFQSCQKEDLTTQSDSGILPSRFKIDLPTSISNNNANLKSGSSENSDTLKGNAIYLNLCTFVAVGEGAADIVEKLIGGIALYHINKPMTLTFEGDDDHRTKNLVVQENATFEGKSWQYILTIYDAASVSNADSGKAIQVFWNQKPIDGIAILKPYNIDRNKNVSAPDAIFRIAYSEVADDKYDSHMIVDIAGLPMADANVEPFAMNNLRMYVGKKGDLIDVYGNSNHPNATFFTDDKGFDWAFVASGSDSKNISTAEVGLPPYNMDETSRSVLLGDYSIKNVLTSQFNEWFLQYFGMRPNSDDLAGYLKNADAPGYFNQNGFVQAGTAPNSDYDVLTERIGDLTPYSPKSVNELSISFK